MRELAEDKLRIEPTPNGVADLVGTRLYSFLILSFAKAQKPQWIARCECGKLFISTAQSFRCKKHCGCRTLMQHPITEAQVESRIERILRESYKTGRPQPVVDPTDVVESVAKGQCRICGTRNMGLCVDHDHTSGQFRGILCRSCNTGLGHFKDSVLLLARAIIYLLSNRLSQFAKSTLKFVFSS